MSSHMGVGSKVDLRLEPKDLIPFLNWMEQHAHGTFSLFELPHEYTSNDIRYSKLAWSTVKYSPEETLIRAMHSFSDHLEGLMVNMRWG
jgi:hypothetical protein